MARACFLVRRPVPRGPPDWGPSTRSRVAYTLNLPKKLTSAAYIGSLECPQSGAAVTQDSVPTALAGHRPGFPPVLKPR
jgi:hypothetical protein